MPAGAASAPIRPDAARILIVDDSAVARAVMAQAIDAHPGLQVAGAVSSAEAAIAYLAKDRDGISAIVLDVNMPGQSGIDALPRLTAASDGARVLLVSSACGSGAQATVSGLAAGAADTLEKPNIGALSGDFTAKLCRRLVRMADRAVALPPEEPAPRAAGINLSGFDAVAIGASTGGIHALGQLLGELPNDFAVPILVTQHLPPVFIPHFADQLTLLARRPCHIARDGSVVEGGTLLIAPGDAHLCLTRRRGRVVVRLDRKPAPSGCLPSVDPMFATAAAIYGARLLAIVLSGMGRDGSIGAGAVAAAGGQLLAQDEASSVVWGMPGAVVRKGLATAMLAPSAIGRLLGERGRPC